MSLRRLLALAVVATLLGPYAASYSSLAAPGGHCSGGICQCSHDHRRASETPAAPAPCHGARAVEADCQIKARCNHEAPVLPGTAVATIGIAEEPSPDLPRVPVAMQSARPPRAGYARLDPQPPRRA